MRSPTMLSPLLGPLLLGLGSLAVPMAPPVSHVWTADTEGNRTFFSMLAAPPMDARTISRNGWKAVCDSAHAGNDCNEAIDGQDGTFWHSNYGTGNGADPGFPHNLTVDMGSSQYISGISSLPRQDGVNHGWIAQHQVYVSSDGNDWGSPVASGSWYADATEKFSNFEPVNARYVRLTALSEAYGQPWTSVAEFNIYQSNNTPSDGPGRWGPTLDFPVVPVAAAIEPTSGKMIVWSAWRYNQYDGSSGGYTMTAEMDPKTGVITERKVQNTEHDMFCPGISMDLNGQIVVTGGNSASRTSIFDSASDSWTRGPDMKVPRGYQASATCSDGRVFTIGGSWSGDVIVKNGEIYDPTAKTWTSLPGALVNPMLTKDPQGRYRCAFSYFDMLANFMIRSDNHGWLFGFRNGSVFQAGPSTAMNWYGTSGNGSIKSAGPRRASGYPNDPDSMCGNAVLFDAVAGKILTLGGSPAYQQQDATNHAHIITIGDPGTTPTVEYASNGMYSARIFANAVVLPGGQTFVTGGQAHGVPFEDSTPALIPEIYDPETDSFTQQAGNSIVRVYHSVALLLPDATVFSGGGGLCGNCSTNHFDAQIFTPQYLLNDDGSPAARPSIESVGSATVAVGGTLSFTTDGEIGSAALLRYGTATHAVNTDQRRVPLELNSTGTNAYEAALPGDSGILLPGYWMLFAMNKNGVPSIASTIFITLS